MPDVVYSAKTHAVADEKPEGAIVYVRAGRGSNALVWIDNEGRTVSESQFEILNVAACTPDTPRAERSENHHKLVSETVQKIVGQEGLGGQLGSSHSARYRVYTKLKTYAPSREYADLFAGELDDAIRLIYNNPLLSQAITSINRQLKAGISDAGLAELAVDLMRKKRLCMEPDKQKETPVAQIICSMGIVGIK